MGLGVAGCNMSKIKQLKHLVECFLIIAKEILSGRTWNLAIIDIQIPEGRRRYEYRRTFNGVELTSFDIIRKPE